MSEKLAKLKNDKSDTKRGVCGLRWRKLVIIISVVCLITYLIILISLNTTWAKNKLIHKLETRSKTKWELGSVLWVPFGDIRLNDLKTTIGKGGVVINSLKISPSWRKLISGSLEIQQITVDEADLDLDLQWIRENFNQTDTSVTGSLQNRNAGGGSPENGKVFPNADKKRSNREGIGKSGSSIKPKDNLLLPSKQKPSTQLNKIIPLDENKKPNRWLNIKKMNCRLRNGDQVIEEISNISASIPFYGKSVQGALKYNFLNIEKEHQVNWTGQDLVVKETSGKLFGTKYQWGLRCKPNVAGFPFVLHVTIPQQKVSHSFDRKNIHFKFSSDKITANCMLNGSLSSPLTWRGIINADSENTTIIETQKTGGNIQFDFTRIVATIANGVFHIPAAEALGHKLSILANGAIRKNLYGYGVVRLIANEEHYKFYEKLYHGSRCINIDEFPYYFLIPLDTRDRRYCDLYLDGKINDLEIRHNRSDTWQPLKEVFKKLQNFKNKELKEDDLFEE